MADDLVLTPGGYRPRAQVHFIPPTHSLQRIGLSLHEVDLQLRTMTDFGLIEAKPAGTPLMPRNVTHKPLVASPVVPRSLAAEALAEHPSRFAQTVGNTSRLAEVLGGHSTKLGTGASLSEVGQESAQLPRALVPDLGSGWITYADWTNASGHPVSLFSTTWEVPPAPANDSGQTVFLFNGIQNSTMIYQPVLQWGPSAAGGGSYWAVASWYADGQGGKAFFSSLVKVNPGDTLVGVMTQTGHSAAGFSYNCTFTGIANTSLAITDVEELTWCIETLEAYGIKSRADYPTTCLTRMRAIELKVGNSEAALAWSPVNAVTDTGQRCVVVSNASPGGEVDLYYSNTAVLAHKAVLGDTSPKSPSIVSFNGRLYIAWKGDGNDHLNVMSSGDNGVTFGNKFVSPETSPQAPALCIHNGMLFIAWKGDGNDHLNVAQVVTAGAAVTGFVHKTVLGDTSPVSPSLASFGGRLYIAWKGDGNDQLNIMSSGDNGATFSGKHVSPETSPQAPGLGVHNGMLFVTWKGDGNDHLNVAQVVTAGAAVTGFAHKAVLGDTSPVSPSLASFGGRLYIAWKGDGNDNLNVMSSTDNGATFGHKFTSGETSPQGPCLGAHNGNLYITWKGSGNDRLNVALVQSCG